MALSDKSMRQTMDMKGNSLDKRTEKASKECDTNLGNFTFLYTLFKKESDMSNF